MVQPVEQGFTDTVRRRPQTFAVDHRYRSAAVFTAYNTDIVFFHAPLDASSTEFRSLSVKRMFSFFRRKKAEPKVAETPAQSPEPVAAPEPAVASEFEVEPEPELTPEPEVAHEPEVAPGSEFAPEPEVAPEPETAPEPAVTPEPDVIPAPGAPSAPAVPAPAAENGGKKSWLARLREGLSRTGQSL